MLVKCRYNQWEWVNPFLPCVIPGVFHIKQYHLECGFAEMLSIEVNCGVRE